MATIQGLFINPAGLAALAALIPLAIIYLTRPEPEKEVLPTTRFFQEHSKTSKLRKALQRLRTNKILLLNILFIAIAALGVAGFQGEKTGESKTVVYDRSASMIGSETEIMNKLKGLGPENTLIVAGKTVETRKGLKPGEVRSFVRENPPIAVETDYSQVLQEAKASSGEIVLLSNLDASQRTVERFRSLGERRGLEQVSYESRNRWGFTGVSEKSFTVTNYLDRPVELEAGGENFSVPAKDRKTVETDFEEGEQILRLPVDGYRADNRLYVSSPPDEPVKVDFMGNDLPHLETAVNLIDGFKASETGEIKVVNENRSVDGKKLRLQGNSGTWNATPTRKQVTFPEFSHTVNTTVYSIEASSNLTEPGNALAVSGESFYINVDNRDIRQRIFYPLLIKEGLQRLSDRKSFGQVNHALIEAEKTRQGFEDGEAFNFFRSPGTEFNDVENPGTGSDTESASQLLSLLLVILLGLESYVLLDRGVLK